MAAAALRSLVRTQRPFLLTSSTASFRFSWGAVSHRFYSAGDATAIELVPYSTQDRDTGLLRANVPLPSRGSTAFYTSPSTTVGRLLSDLQEEDPAITQVALFDEEGNAVSRTAPLAVALQRPPTLLLNGERFTLSAQAGTFDNIDVQQATSESRVARLIHGLEEREERRLKLQAELQEIETALQPLEEQRIAFEKKSNRRARIIAWSGFALLSLQWGFLARLTWWEYSWDLMEPVTYFIGTAIQLGFMGYYLLTQREYDYEVSQNRRELASFYRMAKRHGMDVTEYNRLKNRQQIIEQALLRL